MPNTGYLDTDTRSTMIYEGRSKHTPLHFILRYCNRQIRTVEQRFRKKLLKSMRDYKGV